MTLDPLTSNRPRRVLMTADTVGGVLTYAVELAAPGDLPPLVLARIRLERLRIRFARGEPQQVGGSEGPLSRSFLR